MSNVRVLISTIDSQEAAEQLAAAVISENLAACVNVVPGISSIYHWKGAIQHERESLLILKTSSDRVQELMERLRELHTYSVPEILCLPVETGLPAYLSWVLGETGSEDLS